MQENLYYTPPSDDEFVELKERAMELWQEVDTDNDKYGYATKKINQIKDIANIQDNFMYMVAMFDINNQNRLSQKLSAPTRLAVAERLKAGGMPDTINPFLIM